MPLSINDTQLNNGIGMYYAKCHYADCHILFIVVLSVIMPNVVNLIVVVPTKSVTKLIPKMLLRKLTYLRMVQFLF
jgi:hypothetical protein